MVLWETPDIPLLYPRSLASSMVRDFQGEMFAFDDKFAWLSPRWEEKGRLQESVSVSVVALRAAIALGCEPLILLGQDLSCGGNCMWKEPPIKKIRTAQGRFFGKKGLYGERVLTSNLFLAILGIWKKRSKRTQGKNSSMPPLMV